MTYGSDIVENELKALKEVPCSIWRGRKCDVADVHWWRFLRCILGSGSHFMVSVNLNIEIELIKRSCESDSCKVSVKGSNYNIEANRVALMECTHNEHVYIQHIILYIYLSKYSLLW